MLNTRLQGALSLFPFACFLTLYITVGLFLTAAGHDFAFYQFPATSCALVGFGVALIIGAKRLDKQIAVFARGVGEETVVLMCLIFLLAGAFSAITKATGSVDATVNLGLFLLPDRLILPGIFLIACLVSFAIGTSMGTISTVVPIALGIAAQAGLPLPLTLGAVVGGAMFGDNLSIISDTTIAATSTQGCDMRSKFRSNVKVAAPAALIVTLLLLVYGNPQSVPAVQDFSLIKVLPYALVLILALSGLNVIAVLMLGIFSAAALGLISGSINFLAAGKSIYDGFMSMADIFFLTILIAGLAAIATHEGGLDFLLRKIRPLIKSKRSAELGIAGLVSLCDLCIANNTVAVLVSGKVAKEIASEHQVDPGRSASLLDIFSCVWQGLIPYGAQLLLAASLAHVSPFSLVPYVWYPVILGIFATTTIFLKPVQSEYKYAPANS